MKRPQPSLTLQLCATTGRRYGGSGQRLATAMAKTAGAAAAPHLHRATDATGRHSGDCSGGGDASARRRLPHSVGWRYGAAGGGGGGVDQRAGGARARGLGRVRFGRPFLAARPSVTPVSCRAPLSFHISRFPGQLLQARVDWIAELPRAQNYAITPHAARGRLRVASTSAPNHSHVYTRIFAPFLHLCVPIMKSLWVGVLGYWGVRCGQADTASPAGHRRLAARRRPAALVFRRHDLRPRISCCRGRILLRHGIFHILLPL
jgi:hypothetical protein